MLKIKKGDKVEVTAGKDRGKRGAVLDVLPESGRIVVEKVNVVVRHRKARKAGEKGERINKEAPINASNVMLVCPHTDKPTRVGFTYEGDKKVRVSKKSGKAI